MWNCSDSQEVGLEAATLKRKRNSSLVERFRADNVAGLKPVTEAADPWTWFTGGRGAFHGRYTPDREDRYRAMEETLPAQVAIRRVRTPPAESLRFPEQGQSAQGKSGPKPRPKGVGEWTAG